MNKMKCCPAKVFPQRLCVQDVQIRQAFVFVLIEKMCDIYS